MNSWKMKILHLVMFMTVMVMLIVIVVSSGDNKASYRRTLNEGWTVKLNNGVLYKDTNLDRFHFDVVGAGTQIVITNVLPDDIPENSCMTLYQVHSVTDVYVDDELIYSNGRDEFKDGKMVGYGNDFVSLPHDVAGKELKICFFVIENSAFSTITPPTFYNELTAYRDYISEKNVSFVVAIALMLIGASIMLITFFYTFFEDLVSKLFFIGVFAFIIGTWSLASESLAFIFTQNMAVKSSLEYIALYSIAIPILLYFKDDVVARGRKLELFIYYGIMLVEMQAFVISVILHFANIVHFPAFLKFFQCLIAVCGIFVAYLLVVDMQENRTHKILIWGFAGMIAIAFRDMIAFNVTKYMNSGGVEGYYRSYISLAALLFVVSLFIDFITDMRKRLYSNAQNDFYIKIAYFDVLTDLFTRRKADEIFEELDKSENFEYTLIQFDLNNLKVSNDIYGHEEGDKLIIRFADALKETFNNGEILARMGGDEFIAILNGREDRITRTKLSRLEENIAKVNEEYPKVKVSVSYGYATSADVDKRSAKAVYKLADKRMYEQKANYYRTNGIDRRHH